MKKIKIRVLARKTEQSESSIRRALDHGWSTELLAAASGVSVSYIRRLLRSHRLAGVRINRDWLVRKEDGDAWLKGRGISVG